MDDRDEFLKDMDQQMEWFCQRIIEPVPHNKEGIDDLLQRMVQVGWIRQSEYETYQILTKEDDE